MPKRIAIIITVSNYANLSALPGCQNDGFAMSHLLGATGKYDFTYQNKEYDSAKIKNLLREIHSEHKGSEVDELFFYFSGHGTVVENDFYYCSEDFDETSPSSTGILNGEIDTLFRDVAPAAFIKVIDACHSGFKLIKETSSLKEALQPKDTPSQKIFKDYICFCSSMEDQSSFATAEISYFTKEFIIGAAKAKTDKVMYIDIQNHLLDAFRNNKNQHPYFITQWAGTQVFCDDSKLLIGIDQKILEELKKQGKLQSPAKASSMLVSLVKEQDKIYVSLDDARTITETFYQRLEALKLDGELSELYDLKSIRHEPYKDLPKSAEIARLVGARSFPDRMVDFAWQVKRTPENLVAGANQAIQGFFGSPAVPEPEYELTGIKPKADIVLPWVLLEAIPKYRSIPKIGMAFVPVPGRTRCRVFWALVGYRRVAWDQFTWLPSQITWQGEDYRWSNMGDSLPSLFSNFQAEILERVRTAVAADKALAKEEAPQRSSGGGAKALPAG